MTNNYEFLQVIQEMHALTDRVLTGIDKKLEEAAGAPTVECNVEALANIQKLLSIQKKLINDQVEHNLMIVDELDKLVKKIEST